MALFSELIWLSTTRIRPGFDYFDYARIAPNAFAQPNLWKTIQLRTW